MVQKGDFQFGVASNKPAMLFREKNPTTIEHLLDLIITREIYLINELQEVTQKKMGEGKSIYEIWMREDNDIVQQVARAFGERIAAEFAWKRIQTHSNSNNLKNLLILYLKLHLSAVVLKDLGWYILNDLVCIPAAKAINSLHKNVVDKLHPYALDTVNAFGIPEHLITAPIAQDY